MYFLNTTQWPLNLRLESKILNIKNLTNDSESTLQINEEKKREDKSKSKPY